MMKGSLFRAAFFVTSRDDRILDGFCCAQVSDPIN